MTDAPFDVRQAHRWFAVEWNNLSWDYVEAASRTADQVEQMIHAAHGACLHWLAAGDLLNHLRAQCLLATAYVTAGYPESAVRHAEKCLTLSQQAGDTQTHFDRASTHGCAALAFALADQTQRSTEQYHALQIAFAMLEEADEKEVIQRHYLTPWHAKG
jgi:hypothetical protein